MMYSHISSNVIRNRGHRQHVERGCIRINLFPKTIKNNVSSSICKSIRLHISNMFTIGGILSWKEINKNWDVTYRTSYLKIAPFLRVCTRNDYKTLNIWQKSPRIQFWTIYIYMALTIIINFCCLINRSKVSYKVYNLLLYL